MTSRINYNNPLQTGQFCLSYHYEMLSDQTRVIPFKKAIRKLAKGKRIFESGTGSGILSLLAAKSGAAKVYCTERDPKMAEIARHNIQQNQLQHCITLLPGKNSLKVKLADVDRKKIDILVAENLSTWLVTEPQIQIINHLLNTIAHSETITIPATVSNHFQIVCAPFEFERLVTLKTHYFLFSGIPAPEPLSREHLFYTLHFNHTNPTAFNHSVRFRAQKNGIANAVKLTSPVLLAKGIRFLSSDSLMPPVVVPLVKPVKMKKNVYYSFRARYKTLSNWDVFHAEVNEA